MDEEQSKWQPLFEQVQAAIKEKGYDWVATLTPVTENLLNTWAKLAGLSEPPEKKEGRACLTPRAAPETLPSRVDWRDKDGQNWVTPVKDQDK